MTARAQLRVDPIACDGRGVCAELLPELITLDDWGFPVIHGEVPGALREEAAEAIRLCPKLALWLTTECAAPGGADGPGDTGDTGPLAPRRRRRPRMRWR